MHKINLQNLNLKKIKLKTCSYCICRLTACLLLFLSNSHRGERETRLRASVPSSHGQSLLVPIDLNGQICFPPLHLFSCTGSRYPPGSRCVSISISIGLCMYVCKCMFVLLICSFCSRVSIKISNFRLGSVKIWNFDLRLNPICSFSLCDPVRS